MKELLGVVGQVSVEAEGRRVILMEFSFMVWLVLADEIVGLLMDGACNWRSRDFGVKNPV